jgi:hypothetical protein
MKKIYFACASMLLASASMGQTIANAGMETWRTGTSGTAPVVTIQAPTQWYGFDSTVVAYGQLFGSIIGAGTDWHQQIFEETVLKNSGVASAKVMTITQDVIGAIAGTLSNAKIDVDLAVLSGGGDPMDAVLYEGGTAVTERPTTVSAWVAYFAGKDELTGMMGGADEGLLTVQSIATVGAVADSIVGTGTVNISPSATFTQVTANVNYVTTDYAIHTVRIIFTSSGGSGSALDSSTLYVDDVTMTGVPQAVNDVVNKNVVRVYPNPANGVLNLNSPKNAGLTITVSSVSGQVVATKLLTGNDQLDIAAFASGLYLYSVTDKSGNAIQRGKVSVY